MDNHTLIIPVRWAIHCMAMIKERFALILRKTGISDGTKVTRSFLTQKPKLRGLVDLSVSLTTVIILIIMRLLSKLKPGQTQISSSDSTELLELIVKMMKQTMRLQSLRQAIMDRLTVNHF